MYKLAICTLLACLALSPASASVELDEENVAAFDAAQLASGATALPVGAQVWYREGVTAYNARNFDRAEDCLSRAMQLNPSLPDAYYTMAKVKVRRFNPDALYYAVLGLKANLRAFQAQQVLAYNLFAMILLTLVLTTTIVAVAIALRYLPFVAFGISDLLRVRFNAAAPKLTAYLLVIAPFLIYPSIVTALAILVVVAWGFMHKRERFAVSMLLVPIITVGFTAPQLKLLNVLGNPTSATSQIDRAMTSTGNISQIRKLEQVNIPEVEAEKQVALGMLHSRLGNYDAATNHYLASIRAKPDNSVAYINLGNMFYDLGAYEKALEGYRKAEQIDPVDPVGQYNLAQAFIKTLLMAESTKALRAARSLGIEDVTALFSAPLVAQMAVYPRGYTASDMWRIALAEAPSASPVLLGGMLQPVMRMPAQTAAIILLASMLLSLVLMKVLPKRFLAFQCANCGAITSERTCNQDHGMLICYSCATTVAGVSSDRVLEALLRQRRHGVLVKRRRAARWQTNWLPGVRAAVYGKLGRGITLAALFSVSLLQLWSRGYLVKDWQMINTPTPWWQWVLPALGIILSYLWSFAAKPIKEVRNQRKPNAKLRRQQAQRSAEAHRASA